MEGGVVVKKRPLENAPEKEEEDDYFYILPLDICKRIIVRFPFTLFIKCRVVCKQWNNAIIDILHLPSPLPNWMHGVFPQFREDLIAHCAWWQEKHPDGCRVVDETTGEYVWKARGTRDDEDDDERYPFEYNKRGGSAVYIPPHSTPWWDYIYRDISRPVKVCAYYPEDRYRPFEVSFRTCERCTETMYITRCCVCDSNPCKGRGKCQVKNFEKIYTHIRFQGDRACSTMSCAFLNELNYVTGDCADTYPHVNETLDICKRRHLFTRF